MTIFYIDKDTLNIVSQEQLQKKQPGVVIKGIGHLLSESDLIILNGAELKEPTVEGDVATGNAILNGSIYEREYRSYTDTEKSQQERSWRDSELITSDKEVFKHDDSHGNTVGTLPQWRTYRNALRNYPQEVDFPNGSRPVAPV